MLMGWRRLDVGEAPVQRRALGADSLSCPGMKSATIEGDGEKQEWEGEGEWERGSQGEGEAGEEEVEGERGEQGEEPPDPPPKHNTGGSDAPLHFLRF